MVIYSFSFSGFFWKEGRREGEFLVGLQKLMGWDMWGYGVGWDR